MREITFANFKIARYFYVFSLAELRNPGILFNMKFLAVHSSFSPMD